MNIGDCGIGIEGKDESVDRVFFGARWIALLRCFTVVCLLAGVAVDRVPAADWPLTGALGAHDPSIMRDGNLWWCFSTGMGVSVKTSPDGLAWSARAPVFSAELSWWRTYAPNMGTLDVWAPDVHAFGGRVWCYYCVSQFGTNNSAIGLTSCSSLAAGDWRDDGLVLCSQSGTDAFNALDPSLVTDAAGQPWLVFGSWFDGLHVVQLDPGTMKPKGTVHSIAQRTGGIEGANIVFANGYYYLFASIDRCCLGVDSTYKIAFGRSSSVTGPYADQSGAALLSGGATVLRAGDTRWKGPGGQSVVRNGGAWIIAYHAYDANNNGAPTLQSSDLYWDSSSWPALKGGGVPLATLAGLAEVSGSTDGTGSAARFLAPADVAVDAAGNIYIADTGNHTIRRLTVATGTVITLAGSAGSSGSADATGTTARFNHPSGIAVDSAGTVYVADTDNHVIRKIAPDGVVTTLAGAAGVRGAADGLGTAARFNGPSGLAVDSAGTLYVGDTLNHLIRKISPGGSVTSIAGAAGVSGFADGTKTAARFFGPQGVALDNAGGLYVADTNNQIVRKVVLASGIVSTVTGQAGATGSADGTGSQATFFNPSGLSVDATGNLFVADTDNSTIREITMAGPVVTIAGQPGVTGAADGTGGAARLDLPTGVAADAAGNVYLADTGNQTVRAVLLPFAPAFLTQPQSQTVTAGNSVQFSVTTSGRPAPALQWYFDGGIITGETGTTLNLTNVQAANAGNYTVTAINDSGNQTSKAATLTVNPASTEPSGGGGGGAGGGGGGGAVEPLMIAALVILSAARAAKCKAAHERAG